MTRLVLKAEILLGLALVTRHRAPRLAGVLVLSVAAAAAASQPTPPRVGRAVLLAAAVLASVAASRLLARGPAWAAARTIAAQWWVAPVGRLLGALCAVVPATLGAALALTAAARGNVPLLPIVAVASAYAACIGSCTMAAAPQVGASASTTVGFLGVWLGMAPPSAMDTLLAAWPPLQHVLFWLWNVLPLPWRAARWLAEGGWQDPLLLGAWTGIGLGLAAWPLASPASQPRRTESGTS